MIEVIRSMLFTALLAVIPAGIAMAGPAPVAARSFSAGFAPGLYRITPIDPESRAIEKPRTLCAADPNSLLRLGHNGAPNCHDQFVQPGADRTIVTYSCPAQGWGRAELRRETPSLYQLDTQGIAGKAPFALRAEIRRIGDCPGASR